MKEGGDRAESNGALAMKRIDIFSQRAQGLFDRRRELESIEWKVNFSVWTATAASAWAFHTTSSGHLGPVAQLYWVIFVVHAIAVYRFLRSEKLHVDLAIAYVVKTEELLGCQIQQRNYQPRLGWWLAIETVPTLVLVASAVKLAW